MVGPLSQILTHEQGSNDLAPLGPLLEQFPSFIFLEDEAGTPSSQYAAKECPPVIRFERFRAIDREGLGDE